MTQPWSLLSNDKKSELLRKLEALALYETFAEKGIRNLYEICRDAILPLGEPEIIRLTRIRGLRGNAVGDPHVIDLPRAGDVPAEDPWAGGYAAFLWWVEYRQRPAAIFVSEIGHYGEAGAGSRGRCEVRDAKGGLLSTYYLIHTHDDRADWILLAPGTTRGRRLGADDIADVFGMFIDQQLAQYHNENEP